MFTCNQLWKGIDALAAKHDLTASGLAMRAGLDSTIFNKSKRTNPVGEPRWLSAETISKILDATLTKFSDFAEMVEKA